MTDAPQRTCVGCHQVAPQRQLLRFVLVDGVLVVDPGHVAQGRGVWLHDSLTCAAAARKRRGFAHSLRAGVDDRVLARLFILD